MCRAHEALQDAGASPGGNKGVCVASPVRNEKDGEPEIPEVLPGTGMSNSSPSRSYYCWYRRSGRLCSRFLRSWAKVLPEVMEATEMDSIEAGSTQHDDVMGLEETTAPNSPASRCKQQEKATWSWLVRLLLLYSDLRDKWPVVTKSISSGLIGALGDIVAQAFGWSFGDGAIP